jgi:hypothetical protein
VPVTWACSVGAEKLARRQKLRLFAPCEQFCRSSPVTRSDSSRREMKEVTYDLLGPLLPLRARRGPSVRVDRPSECRRANIVSRAFCKALR